MISGPTSPITPVSSEFLRPDDQCFRKEGPYQRRPAMFSTSGEDVERKMENGGGRGQGPPRWDRQAVYQVLSQEDTQNIRA